MQPLEQLRNLDRSRDWLSHKAEYAMREVPTYIRTRADEPPRATRPYAVTAPDPPIAPDLNILRAPDRHGRAQSCRSRSAAPRPLPTRLTGRPHLTYESRSPDATHTINVTDAQAAGDGCCPLRGGSASFPRIGGEERRTTRTASDWCRPPFHGEAAPPSPPYGGGDSRSCYTHV